MKRIPDQRTMRRLAARLRTWGIEPMTIRMRKRMSDHCTMRCLTTKREPPVSKMRAWLQKCTCRELNSGHKHGGLV